MRELVEDEERGPPLQRGVEIELGERGAAVVERAPRHQLEPFEKSLGLAATVSLDEPDHDVGAGAAALVRFDQHREGLADAGRSSEEDLELGPGLELLLR